MKTTINGEEVKLYFSKAPSGIDICRINNGGTLTLYNEVDSIFQQHGSMKNITVKTEFE